MQSENHGSVGESPSSIEEHPAAGVGVVRLNIIGTLVICAAGVLGLVSAGVAQGVLAPVSGVMALVGMAGFVWSYLHAVNRSREHEISVSQLYFAVGSVAPPRVKRALQGCLAVQVVAAIVVMVAGFSQTDPQEFNWAACIIVAPLYGMGINGVWVATHGSFGARIQIAAAPRRRRRSEPRATSGEPSRADAPRSRSTTRTRTPHPLAQGRPPRPQRSAGGPRGGADDRAPAESRTPPSGMEQNDQHG